MYQYACGHANEKRPHFLYSQVQLVSTKKLGNNCSDAKKTSNTVSSCTKSSAQVAPKPGAMPDKMVM